MAETLTGRTVAIEFYEGANPLPGYGSPLWCRVAAVVGPLLEVELTDGGRTVWINAAGVRVIRPAG